jgi:hypothetical protein
MPGYFPVNHRQGEDASECGEVAVDGGRRPFQSCLSVGQGLFGVDHSRLLLSDVICGDVRDGPPPHKSAQYSVPLKIVLPPPTIKAEDHASGVVDDHRVLHRNVRPFLSNRHHGR